MHLLLIMIIDVNKNVVDLRPEPGLPALTQLGDSQCWAGTYPAPWAINAVDKIRRQEHRELLRQENERLKGTKCIWLCREENLPDKHQPTLEALKATNLKVAKAWPMKESLPGVCNYLSVAGPNGP